MQSTTLALYRSADGVEWERLSLPEEARWSFQEGYIVEFEGRVLIAEAGDGRLQVWASDDPGRVQEPDSEPDLDTVEAFVALKVRLADEVGGYGTLQVEAPSSR